MPAAHHSVLQMDLVKATLGTGIKHHYSSLDFSGPAPTCADCLLSSLPVSLCSTEGLEGSLTGPQELDRWLVATVRAMQESMKNVQRRLESLESKAQPCEQVSVSLLH